MKGLIKIVGVTTVMMMITSCIVHEHHGRRMPPGHAKKVYIYEKRGHGHGHGHHKGYGRHR